LVDYARQLVPRSDWRFEVAAGLSIPEKDDTADMVCFFSVFTHLLPEQSFVYLQESVRVLKPEGKIVFSFLEFEEPVHWPIFEKAIRNLDDTSQPMTTFIERNAIRKWAAHLKLKIEAIVDAGAPHINLERPLTLDSGALLQGKVAVGQSICVLTSG
jgi:ubiquinone/menaquinone biosynthesis C-methylase UbiE